MITSSSFGVMSASLGSPQVGDVRMRGEPSDLVALGSSFSFAEMALAHAAQARRDAESEGEAGA